MSMSEAMRQMPAQAGRAGVVRGEAACELASDEAWGPRHEPKDTGNPHAALLHAAFTRENLQRAFKRVRANKGAAGVDGLDIDQTATYLVTAWPGIRDHLLSGTYRPSAVRRVMIPKPEGGERELGIPTVQDRLIQQALLQVLQPILDPTFSEHSYGFRPGRRAHDAVLAAQAHVQSPCQARGATLSLLPPNPGKQRHMAITTQSIVDSMLTSIDTSKRFPVKPNTSTLEPPCSVKENS